MTKVEVVPYGDSHIMITVSGGEPEQQWRRVHAIAHRLASSYVDGLLDLTPTRDSILVQFDPGVIGAQEMAAVAKDKCRGTLDTFERETRTFRIGVRLGGEFGPDLEEVAAAAGVSPHAVEDMVCSSDLRIRFIGAAGAPMCDSPMTTPVARRLQPRKRVPAGSIALGRTELSVYTVSAPGGWQIIGAVTAPLFDYRTDPPVDYVPGDLIRFVRSESTWPSAAVPE